MSLKVNYLILIFFVLLSVNLAAQGDFREGIIILLDGDTINGELNFQGDLENAKEIEFRNNEVDSVFRPFEITGYVFEDGKYYVSRKAIVSRDTVSIFAEYLVRGEKDLYFHRSSFGFHYLIDFSDGFITDIPYNDEVVTIDGINYQREPTIHIGYLKSYFKDCPELFTQIEQLKALNRKPLISLTKKYHDITCGEGSCVIFERKKHPFRMGVEPVFSHYLSMKFMDEIDEPVNAYGAHLYFWIPNSSERLYIKTGLLYAQQSSNEFFQIPLQFEYVFPSNVVKPKLNIGVNTLIFDHNNKVLTTMAGGGCLVKLADWMYLDFEVSSDLFTFDFESDLFISLAARTGLHIRLQGK